MERKWKRGGEPLDERIDLAPYRVPYYVEKYATERCRPEHLFESERRFLPRVLSPGARVLDVGCACGGFYDILTTLESTVEYMGVDISDALIERARKLRPDAGFAVLDGTRLSFDDGSFDLVQCWGVTLHEPDYRTLLAECWRVSRSIVLFDVRLKTGGAEVVDKKTAFVLNPGGERNFYIVSPARALVEDLLGLVPSPARIELFSYEGTANRFTTLPPDFGQLYMTGVALFKRNKESPTTTELKLDVPEPLLAVMRRKPLSSG